MPTVMITGTNRGLGFELVETICGRWLANVRGLPSSNVGRSSPAPGRVGPGQISAGNQGAGINIPCKQMT